MCILIYMSLYAKLYIYIYIYISNYTTYINDLVESLRLPLDSTWLPIGRPLGSLCLPWAPIDSLFGGCPLGSVRQSSGSLRLIWNVF